LHFRERDIALGQSAIGMEDRVVGILQPDWRAPAPRPLIFNKKPSLFWIAGAVDPVERRFDRRPQFRKRLLVAGPFDV